MSFFLMPLLIGGCLSVAVGVVSAHTRRRRWERELWALRQDQAIGELVPWPAEPDRFRSAAEVLKRAAVLTATLSMLVSLTFVASPNAHAQPGGAPSATLSGFVIDAVTVAGVDGAVVDAVDVLTGAVVASAVSASDGSYLLTGLLVGSYHITATPPLGLGLVATTEISMMVDGVASLTIELYRPSFSGTVMAGMAPLAGVSVSGGPGLPVSTDLAGAFAAEASDGTMTMPVVFDNPIVPPVMPGFSIAGTIDGSSNQVIGLQLPEIIQLAVYVTDAAGNPVDDGTLSLAGTFGDSTVTGLPNVDPAMSFWWSEATVGAGIANVGVFAGTEATLSYDSVNGPVDLVWDGSNPVTFQVESPSFLSGSFASDALPIRGVDIALSGDPTPVATTDPTGNFTVDLPPTSALDLVVSSAQSADFPSFVLYGEVDLSTDVNLPTAISAVYDLTVTLVDSAGSPVDDTFTLGASFEPGQVFGFPADVSSAWWVTATTSGGAATVPVFAQVGSTISIDTISAGGPIVFVSDGSNPIVLDVTNDQLYEPGSGDGSGGDADGDGIGDDADNCPYDWNDDQADMDTDDVGDECDADRDGDGYEGWLGDQTDCFDDDPTIHPGAKELPGDGFDQDCDGEIDESTTPQSDADGDGLLDGVDPHPFAWDVRCDEAMVLQDAVDAALSGDTVWVTGTCIESVLIEKSLSINGYDDAKIVAPVATWSFAVQVRGAGNVVSASMLDTSGILGSDGLPRHGSIGFHASENATLNLDGVSASGLMTGIYYFSGATGLISDCVVQDNHRFDNSGGGIAVWDHTDVTIQDCVVRNNSAPHGAGLFNKGKLTVLDSTVVGNHARVDGGGAYSHRISGPLTVSNTVFDGNSADDDGGGIFANLGHDGTFTNVTLINNTAGDKGGAWYESTAGSFTLDQASIDSISGNSEPQCHSDNRTLDCTSSTVLDADGDGVPDVRDACPGDVPAAVGDFGGAALGGGLINTIVGSASGADGDGCLGLATLIPLPRGIGIFAGDLYVTDPTAHVVRKVDRETGIVSTVAGTGTQGTTGDGGPAAAADLSEPHSVVFDSTGRMFIGVNGPGAIRVVDPGTGHISTLATAPGFVVGMAMIDDSTIVFADSRSTIKQVDVVSGTITTVATGFGTARDVAVLPNGDLAVADSERNRVYRVDSTGAVSTLAGTGAGSATLTDGVDATTVPLYKPYGVDVDADGNIFIASYWQEAVRMVGANGIISTIAGDGTRAQSGDGGPALDAQIERPISVRLDGGTLYIASSLGQSVRALDVQPAAQDPDTDGDGIFDDADNCVASPNADQSDLDTDGLGDACDPDVDGDTYEGDLGDGSDCNDSDATINPSVVDGYGDGIDQDCDGADGLFDLTAPSLVGVQALLPSTFEAGDTFTLGHTASDDDSGVTETIITWSGPNGYEISSGLPLPGIGLESWTGEWMVQVESGAPHGTYELVDIYVGDLAGNWARYLANDSVLINASAAGGPSAPHGIDFSTFAFTIAAPIVDLDGDGFDGPLGDGMDCDDDDGAVYPGAFDTIGDGIDQDCDGADARDLEAPDLVGITDLGDPELGAGDALYAQYLASDNHSGVANAEGEWSGPNGQIVVGDLRAVAGEILPSVNWIGEFDFPIVAGEPSGQYELQRIWLADAVGNESTFLRDGTVTLVAGESGPSSPHGVDFSLFDFMIADPDSDGDGVIDTVDNCVDDPNGDQSDLDGDGVGDVCDSVTHTVSCVAGELFVPALSRQTVVSGVLADGVVYEVTASGVHSGGTWWGDAQYGAHPSEIDAGGPWNDVLTFLESSGPTVLELLVDGVDVEWGPYSVDHTYTIELVGEGAPVELMIDDLGSGNNNFGGQCVTFVEIGLLDSDGDGVGDNADNCVGDPNGDQSDLDGDGLGDACDSSDDRDDDGDGVTVAQGDCDDDVETIYPGAVDVLDNGVDEDCDGADARDLTAPVFVAGQVAAPALVQQGGAVSAQHLAYDADSGVVSTTISWESPSGEVVSAASAASDPEVNWTDTWIADIDVTAEPGPYGVASIYVEDEQGNWTRYFADGSVELSYGATSGPSAPHGLDLAALAFIVALPDSDGDGAPDSDDNCVSDANPGQGDLDGDGVGDVCDPTDDRDDDADGVTVSAGDCDDQNDLRFPGNPEIADDGLDQDCDDADLRTWFADLDGDTYGDANAPALANSAPASHVADSSDCDDARASVYPGAIEVGGDGVDQDCDGVDARNWYFDGDGDGYAANGVPFAANAQPGAGWVELVGDCADADSAIFPNQLDGETAADVDGIDNDCDGSVDEDFSSLDTDGDGIADAILVEGAVTVLDNCVDDPNVGQEDVDGDGIGDACDSSDDRDIDGDGVTMGDGDCNDNDSGIAPGVDEVPGDGIDQDCDDLDASNWYPDADADTFGEAAATPVVANVAPTGHVADNTDCNDDDALLFPGQVDGSTDATVDGVDNDCDGVIDEDWASSDTDGDGIADSQLVDGDVSALDNCPDTANSSQADIDADGFGDACDDSDGDGVTDDVDPDIDGDGFTNESDCGVVDPTVYAGAPDNAYDDLDNDCDGLVDEDVTTCLGETATWLVGVFGGPSEGRDVVVGSSGADVIDALGGDDLVCAMGGDDEVTVSAGADRVFGQAGADVLVAVVSHSAQLDGGAGDDVITVGGSGHGVRAWGGDGDDTLVAVAHPTCSACRRSPQLDGGDGDDVLEAGASIGARLRGGAGADVLDAGSGDRAQLYGGAGDDVLSGGTAKRPELFGDAGADVLTGSSLDPSGLSQSHLPRLHGGIGDDEIVVGLGGARDVRGGNGDDVIDASDADRVLQIRGDLGDDTITGPTSGGDAVIHGGSGHDVIDTGAGNATLDAGDGDDTVVAASGNDNITTGAGDDTVTLNHSGGIVNVNTGDGADEIIVNTVDTRVLAEAGPGDDIVTNNSAGSQVTKLYGNEGDDTLTQTTGVTELSGNEGQDTLTAATADAALFGGPDNDTLTGNPTTIDGGGHIDSCTPGVLSVAVLNCEPDSVNTTSAQGGVDADGDGLSAADGDCDDADATVYPGAPDAAGDAVDDDCDGLVDEDVTTCLGETATWLVGVFGGPSEGRDVVVGSSGADVIDALGGDDLVCAMGGDDEVTVSAGADRVFGQAGADVLVAVVSHSAQLDGGAGDDVITVGGSGHGVRAWGGDGDDTLVAVAHPTCSACRRSPQLDGGDGDDVLEAGASIGARLRGGAGSDVLDAGSGDRAQLYGGAGDDVLSGGTAKRPELFGDAGADVLTGSSLDPSGLSQSHLPRLHGGIGDDEIVVGLGGARDVRGGNGDDVIDASDADRVLQIRGDLGDDTITGPTSGGDAVIHGGSGHDVIDTGAGNATLDAGDGDDTVVAASGNDNITTGAGDDTVTLNHSGGIVNVNTGDGADEIIVNTVDTRVLAEAGPGDDIVTNNSAGSQVTKLYGNEGDDTLTQTTGVTELSGNEGQDTLTAATADAALFGGPDNDTLTGNPTTIDGGGHIDSCTPGVLSVAVLNCEPDSVNTTSAQGGVDADGDGLSAADGDCDDADATVYPGAPDAAGDAVDDDCDGLVDEDVTTCLGETATWLVGVFGGPSEGRDVVVGSSGADVIDALGGDDLVCAMGGDDEVTVSAGADRVFGQAGADVLVAVVSHSAQLDGGAGDDVITVGGSGHGVRAWGGDGDDTLVAVAHPTCSACRRSPQLDGGDGDDVLEAGASIGARLRGGAGSDVLDAGSGDRAQLYGGAGDDVLSGGTAKRPELFGDAGADVLTGSSLDPSGLSQSHLPRLHGGIGDDEIVVGLGGARDVRGGNGDDVIDASDADRVLQIRGDLGDDTITGPTSGGDAVIHGGSGHDVIDTGAGNATLDAGDGDDTVVAASGNDNITTGAGDDTVTLNHSGGIVNVNTGDGVDTITVNTTDTRVLAEAGPGDDILTNNSSGGQVTKLYGNEGADTLTQTAGVTELSGNEGQDTLTAATADAILFGGPDDDTLTGNPNTINGGSGIDTCSSGHPTATLTECEL